MKKTTNGWVSQKMAKGRGCVCGLLLGCLSLTVASPALAVDWNPFPDTGQEKCYDVAGAEITCPEVGQPLHGQDAQYQGAVPSYHDNADGTVTDNNSGLKWMKAEGGHGTWAEANFFCNDLELGGHNDWRLPTKFELLSIIDFGRTPFATNQVFADTDKSDWSSNVMSGASWYTWVVSCKTGQSRGEFPTGYSLFIRCVRSGL